MIRKTLESSSGVKMIAQPEEPAAGDQEGTQPGFESAMPRLIKLSRR